MRSPAKPFAHQEGVVILAHRGFSGRYPENTMLAFEKAAELPIDGLEMDIHATRDDVLVVSHDDSVERMTNGNGKIQSYSLNELKKLDAGYRFSPNGGQTFPFRGLSLTIPTLEDVLSRFTELWINVDIKDHEPRVVSLFCDLIKRHNAEKQLCVGSFSDQTMKQFRQLCPSVVTAATQSEIKNFLLLHKLRLGFLFHSGGHPQQIPLTEKRFGFTFELVNPRLLAAAHRHGMAVHLWTINKESEMRKYMQMGVDGIMTDFPDRALKILKK